jgi:hypothetical protein
MHRKPTSNHCRSSATRTQELRKINTNKAPGPYDPFMKILKTFAKYFAILLTEIFNQKFFPKSGKNIRYLAFQNLYHVRLLHEDLRPISLTIVVWQRFKNLFPFGGYMKTLR